MSNNHRGGRPNADGTPARTYTKNDRTRAFTALVFNGGNIRAAADDADVNYHSLLKWRAQYADELLELERKHGPEIEEQIVRQLRAKAIRSNDIALETLEKLREELDDLSPIEKAKTVQALSVAAAKDVEKLLGLTGRPEKITVQRNGDDDLRWLAANGIPLANQFVDSTAEELPPATQDNPEKEPDAA